jgi:hypothetical protein
MEQQLKRGGCAMTIFKKLSLVSDRWVSGITEEAKRPVLSPIAGIDDDSISKKYDLAEKIDDYFYYFVMVVCLMGAGWLFLIFTKQI